MFYALWPKKQLSFWAWSILNVEYRVKELSIVDNLLYDIAIMIDFTSVAEIGEI
jgi:hypothetical protein